MMKRVFTIAAIAAALATTSCGSSKSNGLDSMSYTIGADLGMNLNFGMSDLGLNDDIVVAIEYQPLQSGRYSSDRLTSIHSVAGVIEWANGVKTPIFATDNR